MPSPLGPLPGPEDSMAFVQREVLKGWSGWTRPWELTGHLSAPGCVGLLVGFPNCPPALPRPCRSQREGSAPYPRSRGPCTRRSWRRSSRSGGCAPWGPSAGVAGVSQGPPLPPPSLHSLPFLTSCPAPGVWLSQGLALCPVSSTPAPGTSRPLPASTCPLRMPGAAPNAHGPESSSRRPPWRRWRR